MDGAPAEFLAVLRDEDLEWLRNALRARMRGTHGHDSLITDWCCFVLVGIPKQGNTESLWRWRLLCAAAAPLKLYDACLWRVLDRFLLPLPQCCIAFRKHNQSLQISAALRWLAAKADEWGLPLVIAAADVHQAFDNMQVPLIAPSMYAEGALAELIAAWIREHVSLMVTPIHGR